MKKFLFIFLIVFFLFIPFVNAADLQWDDPGEQWEIITGYIIYFTDGVEQYNITLDKTDLIRSNGTITYVDIEDKLNLAYGTSYEFYATAYNASGESGPSNTVNFTRDGFVPPMDRLPEQVVGSPLSPGGTRINI